jgi:hypothetical protein
MKIKSFLSLLVMALVATNSLAAQKTSEFLFEKALTVFERSLAGDESVTGVALNQFKILSMTYSDNPLFLAYVGASHTLIGRDAWMSWNQSYYTKKGLKQIDNALKMLKPKHDRQTMHGSPISVETRLIAASTFAQVPKSFNQIEKASGVLKKLFQSPAFKASPLKRQAQAYQLADQIARQQNQRDE